MPPVVVALYAALLALLYLGLGLRVIRLRRRLKVAVGDGGQPELQRAVRVHANFAEYVPLALVLLLLAELQGAPAWLLHALGLALLVGRLIHARGVSRTREDFRWRVAGMTLTFPVLLVPAGWLLWAALGSLLR